MASAVMLAVCRLTGGLTVENFSVTRVLGGMAVGTETGRGRPASTSVVVDS